MRPSIRVLVLVLASATCLAGCGLSAVQRDATFKFARAATDFGDSASSELFKMREQTVAMTVALYRVPDLPPEALNGRDPIVVADIKARKYQKAAGDFSGQWYELFLSGPQAMKAYGTALTSILRATNTRQVKQSSEDFAAALQAIPGSPFGQASTDSLSSVSEKLTETLLDSMKAHAIQLVVESTAGAVPTICRTVGANFKLAKAGEHQEDNFAFRFQTTARVLLASAESGMELHPADRLARSDSLSAYLLAKQNLEEADTVFPQIVKSSGSCAGANAALLKALHDGTSPTKEIQDFYTSAKQTYSSIRTSISGR